MKIITKNQNRNHNNRLLISELINFKIYRTQVKKHFNDNLLPTNTFSSLKQISFNFKKLLQIIFQYHLHRKKILVVGEKPLIKKQFFFIHKKTNHIFISKTAWINGLLSNNKTIKRFLKKKNPMLRLIKKPRLVVLYNYWDLIESESYTRRITNVTLTNTYLEPKHCYDKSPAYYTMGNLTEIRKKKIQFFISTLIEKIIKFPKLKLVRHPYKTSFFNKKNRRMSKKSYYTKTNKQNKNRTINK
jgi:hypothetical protein